MITVRALHADDSLETITLLLHRAYARLGAMGLNYTAVDQSVETTRKRFEGGQGFVAIHNGEIVGTVVVQPPKASSPCEYFRHPHVASIHQFAVEPSRQDEGIGRNLLDACEAWALANGFRETALDTAEQATHLIAQYARRGYAQCGHVQWDGKVYRSVVMSKHLLI
ncbi:MAG: GNAT family N-acetyltransferase [Casimicrobium sp.]